jgi:hypothetical protein
VWPDAEFPVCKAAGAPLSRGENGYIARAASGHATAMPSSSVRNWRRLRSSMGSSPEPAVPAYSRLRMYRKRPQVLGVDLNRSKSSRQRACHAFHSRRQLLAKADIAASRVGW